MCNSTSMVYLYQRQQQVLCNGNTSKLRFINYGVPKAPIWVLYSLYSTCISMTFLNRPPCFTLINLGTTLMYFTHIDLLITHSLLRGTLRAGLCDAKCCLSYERICSVNLHSGGHTHARGTSQRLPSHACSAFDWWTNIKSNDSY